MVNANNRVIIDNLIKHRSESIKSAVLTDDDMVALIRGEEEEDVTVRGVPTASAMEVCLKSPISAVAAAKHVIENLGFSSSEMQSTLSGTKRM